MLCRAQHAARRADAGRLVPLPHIVRDSIPPVGELPCSGIIAWEAWRVRDDATVHTFKGMPLISQRVRVSEPIALNVLARLASFAPNEPIPRPLLDAALNDLSSPSAVPILDQLLAQGIVRPVADDALLPQPHLWAGDTAPAFTEADRKAVGWALVQWGEHLIHTDLLATPTGRVTARHLRTVCQAIGDHPPELAARLWALRGQFREVRGQLDAAQQAYLRAIALSRVTQNRALQTGLVTWLAEIQIRRGDTAGATTSYQEALELSRMHDVPAIRIRVLCALGHLSIHSAEIMAALGQGERMHALQRQAASTALEYGAEALDLATRTVGRATQEAAGALNVIAAAHSLLGDLRGAVQAFEQAVTASTAAFGGNDPHTAVVMGNLGLVLAEGGDRHRGARYLESALAIHERHMGADPSNHVTILNALSELARTRQDYVAARQYLESAVTICAQFAVDSATTMVIQRNLAALSLAEQIGEPPPATGQTTLN